MTVSIHPHLLQFIEEQIKAGRYQSPDEVVNSAVQLSVQPELAPEDLEELRSEVAIGLAELDRGEGTEWDPEELWDEVERRHAGRKPTRRKESGLMPEIIWSPRSRSDWADVLLYIRANKRAAARRLHDQFIETLQLLSQFPEMGRVRPELGRLLRSFPVGNYILIYRPRKSGIELTRVLHGARDIRRIFKRK